MISSNFDLIHLQELANQPLAKLKDKSWYGKTLTEIKDYINNSDVLKQSSAVHQLWAITLKLKQMSSDEATTSNIEKLQIRLKQEAGDTLNLVTLKAGSIEIKVSKKFFEEQNDFFYKGLEGNYKDFKNHTFELEDSPALKAMLQFIEKREINLTHENVSELLQVADIYQQTALKQVCEEWIITHSSLEEQYHELCNLAEEANAQLLTSTLTQLYKTLSETFLNDFFANKIQLSVPADMKGQQKIEIEKNLNWIKNNLKHIDKQLFTSLKYNPFKKLLELFKVCPNIQSAQLPNLEKNELKQLIPYLNKVTDLDLEKIDDNDFSFDPWSYDSINTDLTEEDLLLIKDLPLLKKLSLRGRKELKDEHIAYLQNVALESLDLSGCLQLGDDSLSFLIRMPLKNLDLTNRFLTDKGIASLQGMKLEEITLKGNPFNPSLSNLTIKTFSFLKTMSLKRIHLGKLNIKELPYLKGLPVETLFLGSDLTQADLLHLKGLPIKNLSLEASNLEDKDLIHLKDLPLENLTIINANQLTNDAFFHLKDMKLKTLILENCSLITGIGFISLVGMPLEFMQLEWCDKLTPEAVPLLKQLPLKKLLVKGKQNEFTKQVEKDSFFENIRKVMTHHTNYEY